MGLRQVHTSVDWNGVLEVEHGLLPVGGRVLGTSAERQGVALHIEYNIKVAHKSLARCEGRNMVRKCVSYCVHRNL